MQAQDVAAPVSIRERFLADHHRLEVLLAQLLAAIDGNLVQLEAVRDFLDELRAHTQNEDRLLDQTAQAQ